VHVIGIIPARYESARFPGKPLVNILGKPMICRVAEGAAESTLLSDIIIASDDDRILEAARSCGFKASRTCGDFSCGTERVWDVARQTDAEIIINIQGDEPAITGELLDRCIELLETDERIDVVTIATPVTSHDQLQNPNLVKVVMDDAGFALYFSRAPIPYSGKEVNRQLHYGHVGVYAYRRDALERFCALPPSPLENQERLEQLRGLAAGLRFYVITSDLPSVDVNTPDDVPRAEEFFRRRLEENP
jgi:3-deoxy-manno-octulosonate cytidylyltransferase (CMP-KDO synthetase)